VPGIATVHRAMVRGICCWGSILMDGVARQECLAAESPCGIDTPQLASHKRAVTVLLVIDPIHLPLWDTQYGLTASLYRRPGHMKEKSYQYFKPTLAWQRSLSYSLSVQTCCRPLVNPT
jgi:hypothetical protein